MSKGKLATAMLGMAALLGNSPFSYDYKDLESSSGGLGKHYYKPDYKHKRTKAKKRGKR